VNDHWSRPDACAQQAGDFDSPQQEGTHRSLAGTSRWALSEERPIAHADAGEVEYGTEVKRKAGTAGVVTPCGVHDEDFRLAGQSPDRRLEKRALTQGEQSRPVWSSRLAANDCGSRDMAIAVHRGRRCPGWLARATASGDWARKTHEAPGHERGHVRRVPQVGLRAREFVLDGDELSRRLGPHRLLKYRTRIFERRVQFHLART
jgi:hypothetical protein